VRHDWIFEIIVFHQSSSRQDNAEYRIAEEGQRLLASMERSVLRPAIEIKYPRLLRGIKLYPVKPEVAKAFEADTTYFKRSMIEVAIIAHTGRNHSCPILTYKTISRV
jgi:hypothetical protein